MDWEAFHHMDELLSAEAPNKNNLDEIHHPIYCLMYIQVSVTSLHSKFLPIPVFLSLSVNQDKQNIRENYFLILDLPFSKHMSFSWRK